MDLFKKRDCLLYTSAPVLYNNTNGEVVTLAINTLGVLYVIENGNSINSIEDLKGKTIYSSGKGAIPEYSFNYILEQKGIDPNVSVSYTHLDVYKRQELYLYSQIETKK